MYDRDRPAPGKSTRAEAKPDPHATPGRTTLVEAHQAAAMAYLAAAKPHTTPALAAERKLTGGPNPDHAFDTKVAHPPPHEHHDRLNRDIKNPRGPHVALARPGVTIGHGKQAHDEFTLADDGAKPRYLITLNSDGHQATGHGTISNAQIRAHDGRFAVNPAHVRNLVLPGQETAGAQPCVLTWFGLSGAAWMRTADLKDGAKIASAANQLAHKDNPHAADAALRDTTRFAVRTGGIAAATTRDKTLYMSPHQHSTHSNHKSDYLEDDSGKVNLCMSLPGGHAAAIAIDVLAAGQYFFVPNEPDRSVPSKYVREVFVYHHGDGETKMREVWVFGFVGKSATEPDKSRSGWLPLRVVAPAPS